MSAEYTSRAQDARSSPGAAELLEEWWTHKPEAPAARRVLLAAIELFAERGYPATTTRDLVARAGVTTGALYAHYRSKEELLYEACFVGHQRAVNALRAVHDSLSAPESQLLAMVRTFTVFHAEYHMIARIVHYELHSLSGTHFTRVTELRRTAESLIDDVLRRGYQAGHFAVPDIHGTGRAILSLCIDVARWYDRDHKITPNELGELYAKLAHRMIAIMR